MLVWSSLEYVEDSWNITAFCRYENLEKVITNLRFNFLIGLKYIIYNNQTTYKIKDKHNYNNKQ